MAASEEFHLHKCTPEMRAWYKSLRSFMISLGDDVTFRPTSSYVGFWRELPMRKDRVFAYVNFRLYSNSGEGPAGPHLTVDIPRPTANVAYELGFIQPSKLRGWKTNIVRIWIDSTDDAHRAMQFIAQAYEDV
jgi:hypothetical protein